MTSRKDQIRSMFGQPDGALRSPALQAADSALPEGQGTHRRTVSGSVKAMGLSLDALNEQVSDARRLRESLVTGGRVIEIDPDLIDASPFADRLSFGNDDVGFSALKESMRSGGQQVPVLLRPHPDTASAAAGRYQSAYGHRRIQAARDLGLQVKAIVRPLTDIELATAQGNENAERRDLSFIERAMFAHMLVDSGFDRAVAQAALSVHKSEMSRLLQVAEAIPRPIARAIGAAPKVGRPRWLALGELLRGETARVKAVDETAKERFRAADSDRRFQMLVDRLSATPARKMGTEKVPLKGPAGETIGSLARRGNDSVLTLSGKAGEGFGVFVAARLPQLHAEFVASGPQDQTQ